VLIIRFGQPNVYYRDRYNCEIIYHQITIDHGCTHDHRSHDHRSHDHRSPDIGSDNDDWPQQPGAWIL
jgi:hypothetical protein